MARGCALIDSRPDTAKIGSDGRVEVHRARLRAVFGGRKTFPHGLDPKRTSAPQKTYFIRPADAFQLLSLSSYSDRIMGASMRRREFIGFVGSVGALPAFFWRHAAWAQQARRIAFVHSGIATDKLTETARPFWVRRFYETLRGLGDVAASHLVVERYSAEGRSERFAAVAAEAVSRNPDVIVANHNGLVKAFMTATDTVPIVAIARDPIAAGW